MKKLVLIICAFIFSFSLFAQPQSGTYYKIQAKNNNFFFGINGKTGQGKPVLQQNLIGQGGEWQFIKKSGGFYQIKNKVSKKFVANFGSTLENAEIKQTSQPGEGALWKLVNIGNGYFKFKNKLSNKFIANGGKPSHSSLRQYANVQTGGHWKLISASLTNLATGKINIFNEGSYKLEIFKEEGSSSISLGFVSPNKAISLNNIQQNSYLSFKALDENDNYTSLQARAVYAWKLGGHQYVVKANPMLSDRQNVLDIQHNVRGIDLTTLNPRNIAGSMTSARIFEDLEINTDADYENANNQFIKRGFDYRLVRNGIGSGTSKMYFSSEKMKKAWSLNVSVAASATSLLPTGTIGASKGGGGSVSVGVNSFDETFSSSKDVYVEKSRWAWNYIVEVDPKIAHLSREFKNDVRNLPTNYIKSKYQSFVNKYGSHYATTMKYGGFYNSYLSMSAAEYSKLEGFGVDVKVAADGAMTKNIESSDNRDYPEGNSGNTEVGFSYNESNEEKISNSNVNIGYAYGGGSGDFNNWTIRDGEEIPVSLEVELISKLFIKEAFKDDIDPHQLSVRKAHLETFLKEYLLGIHPLDLSITPPATYKITLLQAKVKKYQDHGDAQKKASGKFEIFGCSESRFNGLTKELINRSQGETYAEVNVPEFNPKKKKKDDEDILMSSQEATLVVPAVNSNNINFYIKGDFVEKDSNWGGRDDKLEQTHTIECNLPPGGVEQRNLTYQMWDKRSGSVQELNIELTIRIERIDKFDDI